MRLQFLAASPSGIVSVTTSSSSADVEIFSTPDGFWALPLEQAARRACEAVRQLTA